LLQPLLLLSPTPVPATLAAAIATAVAKAVADSPAFALASTQAAAIAVTHPLAPAVATAVTHAHANHISDMETNCTNPICYCVFGAYYICIVHGQTNIEYNKSNKAYYLACAFDNGVTKSTIRKKYIRMMKSEPINEFIKQGGTYHTNIQAMLYHTFLVVILGSSVLAKSVEEEVRSNDWNILIRRYHSERYTPCQPREINV
jgi:hypothetical protein